MKKLIILFIAIFMCGCSNKYIICKVEKKYNDYSFIGEYKVYHKKTFVTKIEKYEKYTSNNKDIIKYYSEYLDLDYLSLSDKYGGYEYNIYKEKDKVEVNCNINLSEVDLKQMVSDKYLSKYYVNKGKLSLGGIKLYYKDLGVSCN